MWLRPSGIPAVQNRPTACLLSLHKWPLRHSGRLFQIPPTHTSHPPAKPYQWPSYGLMGHNPQATMVAISQAQAPRHIQEQASNRTDTEAKITLQAQRHGLSVYCIGRVLLRTRPRLHESRPAPSIASVVTGHGLALRGCVPQPLVSIFSARQEDALYRTVSTVRKMTNLRTVWYIHVRLSNDINDAVATLCA